MLLLSLLHLAGAFLLGSTCLLLHLELGSGLLCCGSSCCVYSCGVCRLVLARAYVSLALVYLLEERNNLVRVVCLPELEVGASLEELAHTLRLVDTRHLHHDTSLLALQLLDVGLYYAELVDTCADYEERVVDGCLHLSAENLLHVLV